MELKVDRVILQDFIADHNLIGVYGQYKCPLTTPTNDEIEIIIREIREKYEGKLKIGYPKIRFKEMFGKKCTPFFKVLQINADGYIGSCGRDMLPEKEFGHIDDIEVWNNDYMTANRRRFLNDDEELHQCCLDCPNNY